VRRNGSLTVTKPIWNQQFYIFHTSTISTGICYLSWRHITLRLQEILSLREYIFQILKQCRN
jgi:hypothetical protein